jgi:DMSO/TMAO reductase YedYZ molybdopterin-dependent catalytic subunit
MYKAITRRDSLKGALAAMGAVALIPEWAFPALADGDTDVPFTDLPKPFNPGLNPSGTTRTLDIRKIDGLITPADQFFFIQHKNQPKIDPATYKLKITGLVKQPAELSLADLKAMHSVDLVNGYECSGNSPRGVQGLSSCGRFTGVPLSAVLKKIGVDPVAREVVLFGTDKGKEDVNFRATNFAVDQQFARSITLENALKPEPILAWNLNGEPLVYQQGGPLRLIMPGWYGVANVKWLAEIHLQEERFLGNYQARWYRSLVGIGGSGREIDTDTQWVENEISKMHLKSVIARVRKSGDSHQVLGFVLNDGTPVKSVEVKVDDGPWQMAKLDPKNTKYSWKLFTYDWRGATPGEHTLVSRVTDVNGKLQPTLDDLKTKKTFLQDNSQFPRKVMIG